MISQKSYKQQPKVLDQDINCRLTNIWTQCVHKRPTITVPSAPNSRPALLNAKGIARIPVPNEDFSKCANDPIVLAERTSRKAF